MTELFNNFLVFILIFSAFQEPAYSQDQAVELGKVNWLRSYDKAVALSEEQNKAILILFQEVPGCSTCQNYGSDVLSKPLIVEAIENEFIALAIFNNKKGEDARILEKFNEPSWNNPVVRIVDNTGKDIVSRLSSSYSAASLALSMETALFVSNQAIPDYLKLMTKEISVRNKDQKTAYFSMYCFWSGEAFLGSLNGVVHTNPGFMNGKEAVQVDYDASKIKLSELKTLASNESIVHEQKRSKFKLDKDPQYYLKNSNYKYLALSQIQRTKINSALKYSEDPLKYLSPTQLRCFKKIDAGSKKTKHRILYEKDINSSWDEMLLLLI